MDASAFALVQTLVNGVFLGCLFGCIALGVTVKWGLLGVADFSHLSLVLVSAYVTYTIASQTDASPFLALAITVPVFFAIGVAMQYLLMKIKAQVFTTLLISFGLFIAAESAISLVWTSDIQSMRQFLPDALRTAIRLPEPFDRIALNPVDLLSLAAAVLMVGGAWYALRFSRHGRALNAMHQDRAVAEAFGVRTLLLSLVVSGLAASSAAVAGTLVAMKMPLTPHLATSWLGIVVVSCLLGGLGKPLGALIVAIVLLMIQNAWSLYLPPTWAPAIAYGVLFVYLAAEPLVRAARARLARRS